MTLYSHSRLSIFEQCRLKFKYKYIDKIEVETKDTVETFLGSRVHETLEKLYNDLKFQKLNTKDELLSFLESEWLKNWSDEILIVKNEYSPKNYLDMAKKFVSDYYDKYSPFDAATTIGTEMHIIINLDEEGRYQLQGYIDRLDSKGEVYEIHDYKTANNLPIQEYLDKDRQLAIYAIAVRERYKDAKEVRLIWHFLTFNKEFFSERSDEQLENLKLEIIRLIDVIESCKDFPSKTSALCDWCEYKKMCPEWKHLFTSEEKAVFDDGVKLVDEYSRLKSEESALQKKLEELRTRILSFAEKEGVTSVFGTEQRIKIWSKECDKFPASADPLYSQFVSVVKKLGLWDDFSKLDSFKLEKAFENGELRKEVLDALNVFARKEKIERLYPGKK